MSTCAANGDMSIGFAPRMKPTRLGPELAIVLDGQEAGV